MDFDLSKPPKAFERPARSCWRAMSPARTRADGNATADDDQLWREIADHWTGLIIPEEHGGLAWEWWRWRSSQRRLGAPVCRDLFSTLSAALIDRGFAKAEGELSRSYRGG
jgi:hypothetical protein